MRLPTPPTPPSLVSCKRPRALNFVQLMDSWRGIPVPRIIACEVSSLRGVLPLFLASHMHPVELRLTALDDAVTLAALLDNETAAKTVRTIHPSSSWSADFLGSIEKPACDRVVSISVSFARLGVLFHAQLHLPGLKRLEVILGGAPFGDSDSPPVLSGEELFLRALSLRRVAFAFDKEYALSLAARLESCQCLLMTLCKSFRVLIQYDAELPDEILVSHQIEREWAGFSHLAREYIVVAPE